MQDKWNIDALLSEAAKQDNCALPFTQWKAELLSAAEEENTIRFTSCANMDCSNDNVPYRLLS